MMPEIKNRKDSRKKHFIFDLYGTLIDIHTDEDKDSLWQAMADYFNGLGAVFTPHELKKSFRKAVEDDAALAAGAHPEVRLPEVDMRRVFAALFKEAGVEADSEMCIRAGQYFREQSTEYLKLYEGAEDLLSDLKKIGKVWLLSNAQEIFTMPELDKLGITPYFDDIFISSVCGCKKPDPLFYRQLLDKHHIPAEQAVMIGNDGICDIKGAKDLGIGTVYLHSNLSPDEPLPEADHVLEIGNIGKIKNIYR